MKPTVYYNNGLNTLGIGNPTPPRKACVKASDFNDDRNNGSGDLYPIVGEAPSAYWCEEWKQKREEGLKRLKEEANKEYSYGEQRPMLVFSEEPMVNEKDYKPILNGQPSMSRKLS